MPEEWDDNLGAALGAQLWARRRFVAIACAAALIFAAVAAMLLPRRYTAISRIVIDPPAGLDVRASLAVSPIYLESLRSYELYAASDDLFARAADRFGLRRPGQPIDRLKKSVLKVGLQRNTKVLEITVELTDAKTAHLLALNLAEETVALSRAMIRGNDEELLHGLEKQIDEARARASAAERAVAAAAARGSAEQLKVELASSEELRATIRKKAITVDDPARVERLRRELAALDRDISAKSVQMSRLAAAESALFEERSAAQAAMRSALTRMDEARTAASYRGERLRVLDPGIVPERPSYPQVPLMLATAVTGAFLLSLLWVAWEAGRARKVQPPPRNVVFHR